MNGLRHRCFRALFLAGLLGVGALPPAKASALSPATYKSLSSIQRQMEEERFEEALAAVHVLLPIVAERAYEKAVVLQTEGYIFAALSDYPHAILAFENAIALNKLPADTQQMLRYQLAQLYLALEQPGKAVTVLATWFDNEIKPEAAAWALRATAYAQLDRYEDAIADLEKAIGREPRESWRQMSLALNYELENYARCITLLDDLIMDFPEKNDYWTQLAGIYMIRDDYANALAVMELADRRGYLSKAQERLQLARLYLQRGMPYKAARLIEQDMASGRIGTSNSNRKLLATAWSLSKHRREAIAAWEAVAKDSQDGNVYRQLARFYFDAGDWQKAASALESAIRRGLSQDEADAWLMLGIARYESGNTVEARQAFNKATEFGQVSSAVGQWLAFLEQQVVEK